MPSCVLLWSWTSLCGWRLSPDRGQVWLKATCVRCLDGATTVWAENRSLLCSGRSQCPLFQPRDVTAPIPSMATSRRTWSAPATSTEERTHARFIYSFKIIRFRHVHTFIYFSNTSFHRLVPTYQLAQRDLLIMSHWSITITQFWGSPSVCQ